MSDSEQIDKDGPLKGMLSTHVLISAEATEWLKSASEDTGYSLTRLVEISVEEAALEYAKKNGLLKHGRN